MTQSPADVPWLRRDRDLWEAFLERHKTWARARVNDDVVLCLPWDAIRAALRLYKLDDSEGAAEVEFAELCRQWQAVGYGVAGPIRYSLLFEPAPMPKIRNEQADEFLKRGWERGNIKWCNANPLPHERLLRRWTAAAGRLLSRNDFLAERDAVRTRWLRIPLSESPHLPLQPPLQVPRGIDRNEWRLSLVLADQQQFWHEFRLFCDRWQISEMTTWDLPLPQGPRWSGLTLGAGTEGKVELHTPWHFPFQKSDNQGDVVLAMHAEQCRSHGVDDHESWETHEKLLHVAHWQTVCANRYPTEKKVKGFSEKMNYLLAEVLRCSEERAKKLGILLSKLQCGAVTTLKGYR